MQTLAILFILVALTEPKIPPNFQKCNRKDPDFKKCFLDAAQVIAPQFTKPYKALGLPTLDPLDVSSLHVRRQNGDVAVDQNLQNCKFFGLTKTKFNKIDLDFERQRLDLDILVPEMDVQCDYQFKGKVLLVPIEGNGKGNIVCRNFRLKLQADFEEVKNGGKTHYRTIRSEMESEPELVTMHFDNLFNGNKELSDNINSVINENWKEVYAEVKHDYEELIGQIFTKIMDRFWNKTSLEELFD